MIRTRLRPLVAAVLTVLFGGASAAVAVFGGGVEASATYTADHLLDRVEILHAGNDTSRTYATRPADGTTPVTASDLGPSATHAVAAHPASGIVGDLSPSASDADGGAATTLTETVVAKRTMPVNTAFDTGSGGWTVADTGSATGSWTATQGNPAGSIRAQLLGTAVAGTSGTTTWSAEVRYSSPRPKSLRLVYDKRLFRSRGLVGTNRWSFHLDHPDGSTVLLDRKALAVGPGSDNAELDFSTYSIPLAVKVLPRPGVYTLRLVTDLQVAAGDVNGVGVLFDNIVLEASSPDVGYPSNQTFTDANGWTIAATGDAIAVHSLTAGNPAGSLRAALAPEVLLEQRGTATFRGEFLHVGGTASKATLTYDKRLLEGKGLSGTNRWTFHLDRPDGTSVTLDQQELVLPAADSTGVSSDPDWTTYSLSIAGNSFRLAGIYTLRLVAELQVASGDANGVDVAWDNIGLTLSATPVTSHPTNRSFAVNADGWTSTDRGDVTSRYETLSAAVSSSVAGASDRAAAGSATWVGDFTHDQGTPEAAFVSFEHRVTSCSGLSGTNRFTVDLVAPDGTTTAVKTVDIACTGETSEGGDAAWSRHTAIEVPPTTFASAGTYGLRITTELEVLAGLEKGVRVAFDDVRVDLRAVTYRMDVVLDVPVDAAFESRLDVRAQTTGEAFDVQLLDDTGSWDTVLTVSATTFTTYSTVVQPRTHAVDGTLTVRFQGRSEFADETRDLLDLDLVRLQPTRTATTTGSVRLDVGTLQAAQDAVLAQVFVVRNAGSDPVTVTVEATSDLLPYVALDPTNAAGASDCVTLLTDGGVSLAKTCQLSGGGWIGVNARVLGNRSIPATYRPHLDIRLGANEDFYRLPVPVELDIP